MTQAQVRFDARYLENSPAPAAATQVAATGHGFWHSGHRPTLIAAFLYFDLAFMVWVLLGPLAPIIAGDLALSPAQKGLMVAVPTLAGAVLRLVNGVLVDRIGPKTTGAIGQIIVMSGLASAWAFGVHSFGATLALGVVLGFAGASFAVALPLASRWYPPEHQGKAMGIAGMGNSGTVFAALFAPLLAKAFGWNAVLGLAVIPLAIVFVLYTALAKDAPNPPAPKRLPAYLAVLKQADAWWFMLFYGVTFGGFVGLAASLPIYFTDRFALSPVSAGYCTAACVFIGSLVRPLGGAVADRIGGIATLTLVYAVATALLVAISTNPASLGLALAVFLLVMATLGFGNGAVFQLVPQRFRAEIGVMTGLVGFGGGVGGFYLASSLGFARQLTGSTSPGFLIFAGLAAAALVGLLSVKARWRATWGAALAGVRI
ncbi:NarK/NasA family nitrate transporter [Sphingomonas sp. NFR15]|uniref:nitrate/nitrite transporter n=1 Tax=Sphingomonas sp. NFR15 TaxID=1566282 RepID=UPI00088E1176|nr:nitrate/nitrite transporter [Sphingomonas sp. NFR15]SDA36848.1 MFS transporter, NNP family, nitrate/nitrite transporter [Sphingomonas sp. NFR15]